MEAKHLAELWGAPDNSRLTAKQQSFRLPVHVAAKLAALSDLYPGKTKTQIVGDLLSVALDQMEEGLKYYPSSRFVERDEDGREIVYAEGPRVKYRNTANKYYMEFERELGNDSPQPLFLDFLTHKDDK